jgi:hypothetical protein
VTSDVWGKRGTGSGEPPKIDTSVAHSARIYDYILGGKDNFEADRKAAEASIARNPTMASAMRANRAVMRRMTAYLASEAGVRQFLDIGTGLPTSPNMHEITQRIAPESRVVYVDNDPIVLAHARALLTSTPEGQTAYVDSDARDTARILGAAAEVLDFSQPVGVMFLMVLQYIPDADQPRELVRRIMDAVPAGSYLTVGDTTTDIDTERVATATSRLNQRLGPAQMKMRSRAEIAAYFDGLEFVPPGLVPLPQWRAEPNPHQVIPCYAGIARKP